jgi:hypothetical protein
MKPVHKEHPSDAEPPKFLAAISGFGYDAQEGRRSLAGPALPPSFFVIGAPRCGSTAVSDTLKANPNVSFSVPKETHFLQRARSDDLDGWRRTYVDRYHPALNESHQAMGDGSVSYIFNPEAIRRAVEFDPDARFIAVLRNPVEMIQSFHQRLLYLLDEDQEDFATAWSLQESRAQGRNIPRLCRDPRMLQYGEIGLFSQHLHKVFAEAGRERCLVLLFEDLADTPRDTYLDVLRFIGVDDDGQTAFVRRRESAGFKLRWLQRLLMNPPDWVLQRVQHMSLSNVPRLKRLRKKLKRLNKRPLSTPVLAPETREMIREHFATDVNALSTLLGRDLSHWR